MVLPSTTTRVAMTSCGREPAQNRSGHGGTRSENRADSTSAELRLCSPLAPQEIANFLFDIAFLGCMQTPADEYVARSANRRLLPKSLLSATDSHELNDLVGHVGGRLGLLDQIPPPSCRSGGRE